MKIIATAKFDVPSGKTCMDCAGGGWKEACDYYQAPKPNSPYPQRRISYCKLFEEEIAIGGGTYKNEPLKCRKCREAEVVK